MVGLVWLIWYFWWGWFGHVRFVVFGWLYQIVGLGRFVVRLGYLGRVRMGWVVRSSWSALVSEVGLVR